MSDTETPMRESMAKKSATSISKTARIRALAACIQDQIDRWDEDLTHAEVVGVLEIVKHEYIGSILEGDDE